MDKKKLRNLFCFFDEIRKIYGCLIAINIARKLDDKIKDNENNIDEYPTIQLLAYSQFICNFNQLVNSLFNLYEKYSGGSSLISIIKKDLNYLDIDKSYFSKPYSENIAALRNNFTAHLKLDEKCFKIVEKNTLSNEKVWKIFNSMYLNFKEIIKKCNLNEKSEIPEEVIMIFWGPRNKIYVDKFTDMVVSNLINFWKENKHIDY